MMAKVPVGRSIAHAYEFLFGRFFQIIGTAWLPAVLYGSGYYVVLSNVQGWVSLGDPGAIGRTAGVAVIALLAGTLLHAVIAVSLTQEALGVRKDLALAHLVVGPRELRLFFGLLLYFLLFAVLYTVVAALSVGVMFTARKYGSGLAPNLALRGMPAAVVAGAALVIAVLASFWLSMLRLLFMLAPIASVEHRLRLARAWDLTRGSTIRTFFVLVAVFLPVVFLSWAANRFLLHIGPMAGIVPHATPAEIVSHVLQFYASNAGALALVSGMLSVLNAALLAGASAAAYRTVVNHEEAEPEDDAALVAPLLVAEEPRHDGRVHDHTTPVEQQGSHNERVGSHEHPHDAVHGTGHDGHDDAHAETDGHAPHGHHGGHHDHGHEGHAHVDHGGTHASGDVQGDQGHDDRASHESHGSHDSHGSRGGHESHGGGHGGHDHGHRAPEPEAQAA
jgi:hypothetical protein